MCLPDHNSENEGRAALAPVCSVHRCPPPLISLSCDRGPGALTQVSHSPTVLRAGPGGHRANLLPAFSVCLSLCPPWCLCLLVFLTLCLSLCLPWSLSLVVSVSPLVSDCFSLCLSRSLSLVVSDCVSVSLLISLTLTLSYFSVDNI